MARTILYCLPVFALLLACKPPATGQQRPPADTIPAPPGTQYIRGKIIALLPAAETAQVEIIAVKQYGPGLLHRLAQGEQAVIRFFYGLQPAQPDKQTRLPGLQPGDTFEAGVQEKLDTTGNTALIIYQYRNLRKEK